METPYQNRQYFSLKKIKGFNNSDNQSLTDKKEGRLKGYIKKFKKRRKICCFIHTQWPMRAYII